MKTALLLLILLATSLASLPAQSPSVVLPPIPAPFGDDVFWKPVLQPWPRRLHAMVSMDFTNQYLTPRGANIENQGLVAQPLCMLYWDVFSHEHGHLSQITLASGMWNSWHTHSSGTQPRRWNECDLIEGVTVTLAKKWRHSFFYTRYFSQTQSYQDGWNLNYAVAYDDTAHLGRLALHPFVQWFYDKKSDRGGAASGSDQKYYFQLGVDPTLQFLSLPVRLDFPLYLTFFPPGKKDAGGIGLYSATVKASMPLNISSSTFGKWTVYAAVQFCHISNPGLLNSNQLAGATSTRQQDFVLFHTGFSVYF